ncbi:MAG: hypothetical protein ACTSPY_06380 [Candidatus Helarchaeota archaeon]
MKKNKAIMYGIIITLFIFTFAIPIKSQSPTWTFSTGNVIQITSKSNDHGYYPDIAVNSNGEIFLSYDLTVFAGDDQIRWLSNTGVAFHNITNEGTINSAQSIHSNAIALDSTGLVHIIWIEYNGSTSILYHIDNAGGSFSIGNRDTIDSGNIKTCDIAIDRNNKVWIVYKNTTGIFVCNDGTSFSSSIEKIQGTDGNSGNPKIDAYTYPHVVFENGTGSLKEIFYTKNTGPSFSAPYQVSETSTSFECMTPDIAVDINEVPHIVYVYDWKLVTGSYELFYSYNTAVPYHITNNTQNETHPAIDIAYPTIGAQGTVCIVYEKDIGGGNENIFIKIKGPTQNFQTDLLNVETQITSNPFSDLCPKIAIDSNNNIHVVWYGYENTFGTFQVMYNYGLYSAGTTASQIPSFSLPLIIVGVLLVIVYRKIRPIK